MQELLARLDAAVGFATAGTWKTKEGTMPQQLMMGGDGFQWKLIPQKAFVRRKTNGFQQDKNGQVCLGDISILSRPEMDRSKAPPSMGKGFEQSIQWEGMGLQSMGIAHDLNNLLCAILCLAEKAQYDLPGKCRTREELNHIEKAALRAKDLVQQLSHKHENKAAKRPVSLPATIEETLSLLGPSMPPNVKVKMDISPNCGRVLAESTQLIQVLMNLCTNACQAMRGRDGRLEISVMPIDIDSDIEGLYPIMKTGRYAVLSISDTGCGIPPEDLDNVFKPFFTRKKEGEGTGLGLHNVKEIVTALGGTVTVRSEVGRGTVFTVYLPSLEESVP